eukprot:TRINITY_DN10986_c0_g1_i1.p1 TRINITY_DN10986_c0_g1~~TRINITY_DN10986_c0_g1_i1.p1  ORF type:complete len:2185 (-),score=538.10 TRINITY_DN10986_c0_g1_i1:11-6337(-)
MGDVLVDIIDTVEKEAEKDENIQMMQQFINKALGVAELILHDDKYIVIVKETPNLMNRILCLLDSLKTVENKKILLRVIANLSKDFENKLEIGRLEGFRKILLLLLEKDKELTTEIAKTLKHFLDEISIQTDEKVVEENVKKVIDIVNEQQPSFRSIAGTKIKSVLSEVGNVLVKFTSRVQEMQENTGTDNNFPLDKHAFIPSNEQFSRAEEELSMRDSEVIDMDKGKSIEKPEELEKKAEENISSEQSILKEFMRVQGALSTLTESIQEAALTVQLDLLETISKLLFKSQSNQAEFRKINGYYFLIRIFDTIPDLSSEESHAFLEQAFKLLYPICLDGNVSKRVGNPDALLLLFRVVSGSSHSQVRLHSLSCIQDIISSNPLNVVDIFQIDGIDYLTSALRCGEMSEKNGNVKQLNASILSLLQYIGVISSRHDLKVLNTHFQLLDSQQSGIRDPSLKTNILQSLFLLLSDHIYRDNECVIDSALEICNNILKPLKTIGALPETSNEPNQKAEAKEDDEIIVNFGDEISNLLEPDQIIILLRTLGLLIRRVPEIYHQFFSNEKALDVLIQLFERKANMPPEVIDLTLWILSEVILMHTRAEKQPSEYFEKMADLLNFSKHDFSNGTKMRICYSITELVQELRATTIANITHTTQQTLLLLCEILKTESDQQILSAAWTTLGQIIKESEPNKTFIGRQVGYDNFAEIVKKAAVLTDRASFDVILELSCYGLSQTSNRISYFSHMTESIHLMTDPQPLFTKLFDSAHGDSSLHTHPTNTADSISEDDDLTSIEFGAMFGGNAHPSPLPTAHVQQPDFRYIKTSSLESMPEFTPESVPKKSKTKKQKRKNFAIFQKDATLTASSTYRQIARVQIRNAMVTPLLLKTIVLLKPGLQKEILKLLIAICQSNEGNKKVLSNGSGLVLLIEIVKNGCHESAQSYFLKLIALLGLYDITPSEVSLMFGLALKPTEPENEELQKLMLYVLAAISERVVPPTYFSFSGLSGHFRLGLLDKFPSSKIGYTLSCWVKLNALLNPEEGLFSWNSHQNNETIFDLYFKTFTAPATNAADFSDGEEPRLQGAETDEGPKESCLLCVQTQDPESPPESFSFDKYNFGSWGSWHHVVLTHCKQEVVLFVDGRFVQSCTTLNYPRNISKDKALTGYIGRRGSTKDSHFSGQIGTVHFLNGVWDKETVKKVYQRGTFWNIPSYAAETGTTEFLTIRPEAYLINEERRNPPLSPRTSTPSLKTDSLPGKDSTAVGGSEVVEAIPEFTPLMGSIQDTVFPPGVVAHDTKVLQHVIKEAGGLKYCFALLEAHPEQQVPILRIIAGLLFNCPENLTKFEKQDGYNILFHLLRKNLKSITQETFDIAFDLLCNTHEVTKILPKIDKSVQEGIKFIHAPVLHLILRLLAEVIPPSPLPESPSVPPTQDDPHEMIKHTLHTLQTLLMQSEANIMFFLNKDNENMEPDSFNFMSFLEIFGRCTRANLGCQILQRILSLLLPCLHQTHIEMLFSFIVGSNLNEDFPGNSGVVSQSETEHENMKTYLVQEIFNQMTKQPQLVEHLRNFGSGEGGGFRALLTLLKSSETTKVLALKMIGLLLERNKNSTAYFIKNSGFEMISLLLAPFPITLPIGRTLIGLALDEYRCDGMKPPQGYISWGMSWFTGDEDTDATNKNRIIHPEAIQVLFELIKFSTDESLKTSALIEVSERLLTETENMEILWERCSWLDWCLSFLDDDDIKADDENRATDLSKSNEATRNEAPRNEATIRTGEGSGIEEDEDEEYHSRHNQSTLRQLGVVIRKLMIYEIYRKGARFSKLKDIENEQFQGHVIELIIDHFDKNPKLPRDVASIIIDNLVSLFKHAKGLKFHPRVYVRILDVIATLTVHNTAEIRALMNKQRLYTFRNDIVIFLLQSYKTDPESTHYLLEHFEFQSIAAHDDFRESYGIHHLLQLFHDTFQNKEERYLRVFFVLKKVVGCIENKIVLKDLFDDDVIFNNFMGKSSPEEFTKWYFSQSQAISKIENTLKKALSPHEAKFKTLQEKLVQEQANRLKKSKGRNNASQKWNNFAAIEQKRKRDEKTSRVNIVNLLQNIKDKIQEMEKKGSDQWAKLKKKINL